MIDYISANAGVIGLIIFIVFFAMMFLWTFRPGSKKIYTEQSHIPFEEND